MFSTPARYSERLGLKSLLERLSWLRISVVFPSALKQMLGSAVELDQDLFIPSFPHSAPYN
jgi:hypothetical protein